MFFHGESTTTGNFQHAPCIQYIRKHFNIRQWNHPKRFNWKKLKWLYWMYKKIHSLSHTKLWPQNTVSWFLDCEAPTSWQIQHLQLVIFIASDRLMLFVVWLDTKNIYYIMISRNQDQLGSNTPSMHSLSFPSSFLAVARREYALI